MNNVVEVTELKTIIAKKQVLKGLSFKLEAGRVIGLLGPNGAGKTSLLKTLMNQYSVDSGEVKICGEWVSCATKRHISFMPDQNYLFEWMRVRDAIHYFEDMFSDFDFNSASKLCTFLGIGEDAKVKDLSKGMRERVLIMLTFSRKVPLYLLDEPIGGIDPLTRNKIIKTIFAGLNEESSIMIATHLVKEVETLLDDVLFLNEGQLVFSGSVDTIREVNNKSIEEWYVEVFENV